jgi:hypothetical protein
MKIYVEQKMTTANGNFAKIANPVCFCYFRTKENGLTFAGIFREAVVANQ